ncbi:MAG: energy transducer TonB [Opitutaceae bacterium]|nr:energy transducer TonB [Verrucomicrobiales bacterium]
MKTGSRLSSVCVAMFAALALASMARAASPESVVAPLSSTNVHNLFRASTNVFSGNSPEGDAAFAEIAKLGVKTIIMKTIISVDGGKPVVETARKFGLRYIHLPIGYDGVPTNRVAELVKAAQSSGGPFYVHCHHGLHRGPAAVAVMCEATAGWTTNQAVAWLKQAGTSADYAGLYRSAIEFHHPDPAVLARIVELPEVAKTSSLVDVMVAIDEEFDRLKAAQKAGWSKIPNQPDLTPAQTATMLWEHFREMARADETTKRPEDYRKKLSATEQSAEQFRAILRDDKSDAVARDTAMQAVRLWKFDPAQLDGRAVTSKLEVPIRFQLTR